jgi:hypothetical protein
VCGDCCIVNLGVDNCAPETGNIVGFPPVDCINLYEVKYNRWWIEECTPPYAACTVYEALECDATKGLSSTTDTTLGSCYYPEPAFKISSIRCTPRFI